MAQVKTTGVFTWCVLLLFVSGDTLTRVCLTGSSEGNVVYVRAPSPVSCLVLLRFLQQTACSALNSRRRVRWSSIRGKS